MTLSELLLLTFAGLIIIISIIGFVNSENNTTPLPESPITISENAPNCKLKGDTVTCIFSVTVERE